VRQARPGRVSGVQVSTEVSIHPLLRHKGLILQDLRLLRDGLRIRVSLVQGPGQYSLFVMNRFVCTSSYRVLEDAYLHVPFPQLWESIYLGSEGASIFGGPMSVMIVCILQLLYVQSPKGESLCHTVIATQSYHWRCDGLRNGHWCGQFIVVQGNRA